MKIDRLLGLLNILVDTDRITVNELAERFEVSKRTIFRDIDTLNQAGIPIVTYSGVGGGVSVVEGYKYKKSIFSKNDKKNIFIALSGLISINKNQDLINLMAKLIPEETKSIFSESDYLIDLSSWFKESITNGKVNDLYEALEMKKSIHIDYISKKYRKERVIHPYKLIFKQSYWYIYAFCEEDSEFRLFKINRIASYEVMDRTFERKSIEELELISNFGNDFFCGKNSKGLYEVKLEYEARNEFFLTEKFDGEFLKRSSESEKGYIIFQVNNLDWASDLVISMQDKVKVISPPELIDNIKLKLKNIMRFYKDDI